MSVWIPDQVGNDNNNMLEVKEIHEKKIWQDFLENPFISFYPLFQSWNWAEVQKAQGIDVMRLGLFDSSVSSGQAKLVGVCLITDVKARRARFLHLRHGPVLLQLTPLYFDFFIEQVKKIAQEKHASFLRISPTIAKDKVPESFFKTRGFLPAPLHNMDAELCWVLELGKSENELLKEMRKTHRYLIRKALTMPITIIKTSDPEKLESFLPLYKSLSQRKHFVPHKGLREELAIFGQDNQALLFLAVYHENIIGGAIIDFVGNTAIYHHGATDATYRDIPASYLLQWEAIKEAKRRGLEFYNFWGVAPEGAKKHPWQGHTLFKTGFGGHKLELIHAHDLPLNIFYWKNYAIEYVRKKMKGY